MPNAVLWIEDQENDRAPTHCVKCGEPTEGAARIWAIHAARVDWLVGLFGMVGVSLARAVGRPAMQIMVPVEPQCWKIWQRRATLTLAVVGLGLGVVLQGLIQSKPGLMVFGATIGLAGICLRARAFWNFWVSAQLRPERGDILIRRAHNRFGDDAKRLYAARIKRR